jgi:peroxiredoxin
MASFVPVEREMAPDFVLRSSTGREYQLASFRGRKNLVLVFVGSGAPPGQGDSSQAKLLQELEKRKAELQEEDCQLFVILSGNMVAAEALRKRDRFSFTILADETGSVHARYHAGESAVIITDRYGEIYRAYREQLPDADDLLASLRHINAECPE